MKRNYIALGLLLALLMGPQTGAAQTGRRKTAHRTTTAKAKQKNTLTAAQLMAAYRFDEAQAALQRELHAAAAGSPEAEALQRQLLQAETGARMLSGTAQVVFVDSVLVPRWQMLEAIPLSAECGRLLKGGKDMPFGQEQTGYMPAIGDRVFFARPESGSREKLCMSYRMGQGWSPATPLAGLNERDERQQTPVQATDGTTLYYSAEGNESLGGLDIYVTTYNNDTRQYVQPENLGMPFNSPAADYLYVIDEDHALGWFVSERHGLKDSVCVYTFIPPATRQIYDETLVGSERLRRLARIASIRDTWEGHESEVSAAQKRLQQLRAHPAATGKKQGGEEETFCFVVNDDHVCRSLNDFRQPRARALAQQWVESQRILSETRRQLDEWRREYAASTPAQAKKLAPTLVRAESDVESLEAKIRRLANEIRKIEKP